VSSNAALNDAFYWFRSRYLDTTIGKFHTPDSIVPDPGNPQALNRYSYVMNQLLKFIDPTGHALSIADNGGSDLPTSSDGSNTASSGDNSWQGGSSTSTSSGPTSSTLAAQGGDAVPSVPEPSQPTSSSGSSSGSGQSSGGASTDRSLQLREDFTMFAQTDLSLVTTTYPNPVTGAPDTISDPLLVRTGNGATAFSWAHGWLYAGVRERVTAEGTELDLWASFGSPDPSSSLAPSFAVTVGRAPYANSIATQPPGRLYPYRGATIRSNTQASALYTTSLFIPRSVGTALHVSITANPLTPGAFAEFDAGSFEFGL
jgi:RHS repeat-associated protein